MGLSVKNIIKTYGDCNVVNDISFDIKEGEILGLVGHNGAGKTTTFRMILGLIEKNSGCITFSSIYKLTIFIKRIYSFKIYIQDFFKRNFTFIIY